MVSAVVQIAVALFSTPIPYVAASVALGLYLYQRYRRERLAYLHWKVTAALQGLSPWSEEQAQALWAKGTNEPDVLVLQGAYFANLGHVDTAVNCVDRASSLSTRFGRISHELAFWLPGQVEPIGFGSNTSKGNAQLVRGHLELLRKQPRAALEWLETRMHEPHYAAVLATIADAHRQCGDPARAVAILRHTLPQVGDEQPRRRLRHRLASMLEGMGLLAEAAHEFRSLAWETSDQSAAYHAAALEQQLRDSAQRLVAQADAATYQAALLDIRSARGPRSRDRAFERWAPRLQQPHLREQLLLDASKLEAKAVLDKVAGLKTKAAQVRNLEEALYRLRSDGVPDQLQAAEISELQRVLAEVEASEE